MPPRQPVDERLDELDTTVANADSDAVPAVLGTALADRHYRVVALGARLAAERLEYALVPQLLDAYARFLDNPIKRDPNCLAKKAIVRALFDLDCDDADFYLAGLRYRQLEPVWGGTVDTAADVRCSAAMGLVACGYPRALVEVAELLTDSEGTVRGGAARAIACGNPRDAELLLRLKVRSGDVDPLVIGECFTGLMTVEPEESLGFVARYLKADDDGVREAAALALGESRLPAALDPLISAWEDVLVPEWFRQVLIRAAAIHRSDEAFGWLLTLVDDAAAAVAMEIVEALSIYRHNEKLAESLRSHLKRRGDEALSARFAETWTL